MQAWEDFLRLQERELGKETIQKWLRSLNVLNFDAGNLYLEAKDSFQALWFEEHVRKKAEEKLVNNNHRKIKVHLSVAGSPFADARKKSRRKKGLPIPEIPRFTLAFDGLDPQYSFEHFLVSEHNLLVSKLLHEIAGYSPQDRSSSPPTLASFNPVYLHGASGSGKTHLLMATAHALQAHGLNVIYVRAETFTEHVVIAIRAGEMSYFRQAYRNADVLLIDDVHIFSRKGATQEEFFHAFNTLHLGNKQIILSANCSPHELQFIEPRLVSRFEWGVVLPLEPLKREDFPHLLQKKAQVFDYSLESSVAQFLEETFASNPKTLVRALKALVLRSHLNRGMKKASEKTLSLSAAKEVLADLVLEEERSVLTSEKIIQTVAEFYGIRSEDILSKAQSRDCVLPRQIAMYLCRNKLNIPFMKIGDIFSRDHSTVMSSVKLVQQGVEAQDQSFHSAIQAISKKLQK